MRLAVIIEEIFGLVFELFFQVIFQGIIEVVGWFFGGTAKALRDNPELKRALAVVFFAMSGVAIGAFSLLVFPALYIKAGWLRWANLAVGPVAGGLLMVAMENLIRGKTKTAGDGELFVRGWLFCLGMSGVRFAWGR